MSLRFEAMDDTKLDAGVQPFMVDVILRFGVQEYNGWTVALGILERATWTSRSNDGARRNNQNRGCQYRKRRQQLQLALSSWSLFLCHKESWMLKFLSKRVP